MPISESLTFPGFEELIYVWDSSSLINMKISGNLRELREFAEHHNGRIRIPIPIGKEIGKRDDDLRAWWLRNQALLGTKFYSGREHKLHQEITVKYAKEPFRKEGKTHTSLSDADTYAVVVAIARHWTLVTDENAMQAICRQNDYDANYMSSTQFRKVIGGGVESFRGGAYEGGLGGKINN